MLSSYYNHEISLDATPQCRNKKRFSLFLRNFLDSLKWQIHKRGSAVSSSNNINLKTDKYRCI